MLTPLLSLSDFRELLEIPQALELARLRPHLVETQASWLEDGLQPWPTLYAALAAAVGAQAAAVLAGTVAAPLPPPLALLWAEARPMLVYASYASFLPFAKTTLTAHSLVEKLSDSSSPAADSSVSKQVTTFLGWAKRYQVKLQATLAAADLTAYGPAPACSSDNTPQYGTVAWLPITNPRRR